VNAVHFLDTNILLYSISRDAAETLKREKAIALLDRDGGAVSVQVFQEFYVQATRATRPDPLSHEVASGLIETWMRFTVQEITVPIFKHALALKAEQRFSYWDSAIIAAARTLGCRELFSEDMAHGREIDGVLITNPFR
jgi:predicted nucleic acid-binding protein